MADFKSFEFCTPNLYFVPLILFVWIKLSLGIPHSKMPFRNSVQKVIFTNRNNYLGIDFQSYSFSGIGCYPLFSFLLYLHHNQTHQNQQQSHESMFPTLLTLTLLNQIYKCVGEGAQWCNSVGWGVRWCWLRRGGGGRSCCWSMQVVMVKKESAET